MDRDRVSFLLRISCTGVLLHAADGCGSDRLMIAATGQPHVTNFGNHRVVRIWLR